MSTMLLALFLLLQSPQKVSGTVTIATDANDVGCGIGKVQVFVDNVQLGGDLTTAPYNITWDTRGKTEGNHEIKAIAFDKSGGPNPIPGSECNSAQPNSTTALLTVEVDNMPADTTPPTIRIITPLVLATVSGKTDVQVAATDDTAVEMIRLFVAGQLKATASQTENLNYKWNTNPYKGKVVGLRTEATDSFGNKGTHEIQVRVK